MELKELMNKLSNLFKSEDFVQSLEQSATVVDEPTETTEPAEVVETSETEPITPTESTETTEIVESQPTTPSSLTDGWLIKDGEQIDFKNIDLTKVNDAELRQVLEAAQTMATDYNSLKSNYSQQAEQLQNLTVEVEKMKAEVSDSAGGFNPAQAHNEATSYVPGMDLETCIDLATQNN